MLKGGLKLIVKPDTPATPSRTPNAFNRPTFNGALPRHRRETKMPCVHARARGKVARICTLTAVLRMRRLHTNKDDICEGPA